MRRSVLLSLQLQVLGAAVAAAAAKGAAGPEVARRYCTCHDQDDRFNSTYQTCVLRQVGAAGLVCRSEMLPFVNNNDYYGYGVRGIVRMYNMRMPYQEAQNVCDEDGGRLAVPQIKEGYKILAAGMSLKGVDSAWTGINDLKIEGTLVDPDGFPPPPVPLGWVSGKANNWADEDCAMLSIPGKLEDNACYFTYLNFLCERRMSVQIPKGYWFVSTGRSFYKFFTEKLSHASARKRCEQDHGTLVAPETYDEVIFIIEKMRPKSPFWVDFSDDEVEGQFVSSQGKLMEDLDFNLWYGNEPDNKGKSGEPENCVSMITYGVYRDFECGTVLNFICEIKNF